MLLTTTFALKGATTIVTYAAHHGVATKFAIALYKAYKAYSLTQLASTALGACVVIGGLKWSEERILNIKNGVKALENGDNSRAIKEFGRLALSLSHLGNTAPLSDNVSEAMTHLGYSADRIKNVSTWVNSQEQAISSNFCLN